MPILVNDTEPVLDTSSPVVDDDDVAPPDNDVADDLVADALARTFKAQDPDYRQVASLAWLARYQDHQEDLQEY